MDFEAVMKQMRIKYIADLKKQIKELKEMTAQKDQVGLESFFHKLKGSGTSYGLPQFSEYGAKYESIAKKKELRDEDFKSCVDEYEALFKDS